LRIIQAEVGGGKEVEHSFEKNRGRKDVHIRQKKAGSN